MGPVCVCWAFVRREFSSAAAPLVSSASVQRQPLHRETLIFAPACSCSCLLNRSRFWPSRPREIPISVFTVTTWEMSAETMYSLHCYRYRYRYFVDTFYRVSACYVYRGSYCISKSARSSVCPYSYSYSEHF